jgi:hypothetical protein
MKKVLVTGSFEGAVVLLYGESGVGTDAWPPLLSVDLGQAVLKEHQKRIVLNRVPLHYGPGFEAEWGNAPLQFVCEDYEVDFERDFFVPYGKPVNKARCLKWWANMSVAKRQMAVMRMGGYDRHLARNLWKTRADPENWLKKEMYATDWDKVP